MKKTTIFVSILALFAFAGCTIDAGDPITQSFSVSGAYTDLSVEDAFDVTVSDSVNQVVITAGDNIMPYVIVKESGKSLQIYIKGWRSSSGTKLKAVLPYNAALAKVDLSGASSFCTAYGLSAADVELDISGASDFVGDIKATEAELDLSGASSFNGLVTVTELHLDMSGSSDATVAGQVAGLDLEVSGASTMVQNVLDGNYALSCDVCTGSLSGASTAYLHSDGSIRVSLSGGSKLHYTGNAATSGCSTSGSSNVVHDVF